MSEKSQALVQAEQALEAATAKVKVLEQQDAEKGASLSEKSQALVQAEQAIKAAKERVTVLEQQDTDNRTMLSQTVKTVDDLRQDKKEIAERLDKATATVEELQKQAAQRGSVVTEETLQQQKTAFEKERGKYQALIKQRDDLIAFLKQDLIEIKTQLIKEVKAHKRTISGRENSINDTSVSSTPILVRYNPNASISSVASSRNASPISSSTPTQKQ